MRVGFDEDELGVLTVRVGPSPGARLFALVVALIFFLVGVVFLLASLPHSEVLRCERRSGSIACTRTQELAGRWAIFSRSRVLSGDVRAAIGRGRDEGRDIYRVFLEGDGGRLYYGKTKGRREDAVAAVARVNIFLGDPGQPSVEVREDVWWWFMVPFGLLGIGVGALVSLYLNVPNTWVFDRRRNEARGKSFPWSRKLDRWSLDDVTGVAVSEHTDSDGDTFYNLRLVRRGGDSLEMSRVSPAGHAPAHLEEAADRINRFLGLPPSPPGPARSASGPEAASRRRPR